jgi:hypothetical protein
LETSALDFDVGVGAGAEYTNNVTLVKENPIEDVIVVSYLGARLIDLTGPVTADVTATMNNQRYTNGTYRNSRYFTLAAGVDWEMIKDRFDWQLNNLLTQGLVINTDPNTPDNTQDTNVFTFGANMFYPISGRQSFTLFPQYRNFYYEKQDFDNQQGLLLARWDYKFSSTTYVGLNARVRAVDYQLDVINDVSFTEVHFAASGSRARSEYSTKLGTVYVNRSNGQSTEEFSGNLNWLINLTAFSTLRTFVATGLTDGGTATFQATVDPGEGNPNDIQITSDVIRNQVITIGYEHGNGARTSGISASYRNLNYSESLNDRKIRSVNAAFNYPVTALLVSGLYAGFNNTEFTDANRTDERYNIRGNLIYQLSRSLNTVFDLGYRTRESTDDVRDYSEWSAYISLTYGFGKPQRPGRTGGV